MDQLNAKKIGEDVAMQVTMSSEKSPLQEEYTKFFIGKLAEFKVDSPADLDTETSIKFFNEISRDWPSRREAFEKSAD